MWYKFDEKWNLWNHFFFRIGRRTTEKDGNEARQHTHTQSSFRLLFSVVCVCGSTFCLWINVNVTVTVLHHHISFNHFLIANCFHLYTLSLWWQCVLERKYLSLSYSHQICLVFHVAVNTFSFSATFLRFIYFFCVPGFIFFVCLAHFFLRFYGALCAVLCISKDSSRRLFFFLIVRSAI